MTGYAIPPKWLMDQFIELARPEPRPWWAKLNDKASRMIFFFGAIAGALVTAAVLIGILMYATKDMFNW